MRGVYTRNGLGWNESGFTIMSKCGKEGPKYAPSMSRWHLRGGSYMSWHCGQYSFTLDRPISACSPTCMWRRSHHRLVKPTFASAEAKPGTVPAARSQARTTRAGTFQNRRTRICGAAWPGVSTRHLSKHRYTMMTRTICFWPCEVRMYRAWIRPYRRLAWGYSSCSCPSRSEAGQQHNGHNAHGTHLLTTRSRTRIADAKQQLNALLVA